jgi:hypothetical protein
MAMIGPPNVDMACARSARHSQCSLRRCDLKLPLDVVWTLTQDLTAGRSSRAATRESQGIEPIPWFQSLWRILESDYRDQLKTQLVVAPC